jgi:hypothetical protein
MKSIKNNIPNVQTYTQIISAVENNDQFRDNDKLRSKPPALPLYTSTKTVSTTDALAAVGLTTKKEKREDKLGAAKTVVMEAITREYGSATAAKVSQTYFFADDRAAITIGELKFLKTTINDVRLNLAFTQFDWKAGGPGKIGDFTKLSKLVRDFPEFATNSQFPSGKTARDRALLIGAYAMNAVEDALNLPDDDARMQALNIISDVLEAWMEHANIPVGARAAHRDEVKEALHHVMDLVSTIILPAESRTRTQSVSADVDGPRIEPKALWEAYQVPFHEAYEHLLQDGPVLLAWENPPPRALLMNSQPRASVSSAHSGP